LFLVIIDRGIIWYSCQVWTNIVCKWRTDHTRIWAMHDGTFK